MHLGVLVYSLLYCYCLATILGNEINYYHSYEYIII